MAKVTKKQESKRTEKPVEEPVKSQEEEELDLGSSSDESDIVGLSEGESNSDEEEDENVSRKSKNGSHTIRKLDAKKKVEKGNKKETGKSELSGIIYISRLPKGFHERELAKYFSQFGDLKEVRLARNKKTGNSRHYGFVEFVNKDDAVVAQEAMHNYLLLGHLLQVVVLPKGKKIEKLFKYRKRVYKEMPVTKDAKELNQRAQEKHKERVAKLQEKGITFKW